jgi:rubrerythrin
VSKLSELLNARHEDLDFELGMLLNNRQLLKNVAPKLALEKETSKLVETLENHLLDKLSVDLEEIAEDEEIEVDEIGPDLIDYALGEAFNEAKIEWKSYLQLDNIIANVKSLGGTEEEVKGLQSFKKRLEKTVFDRYNITEEDLKEEEE